MKKQKLKILQVLPALNSGGVERGTAEINTYLIKHGCQSFVASEGGVLEKDITSAGGIHENLALASKNPVTIFYNINLLSNIIKKYNIDIVHARSRAPAWSAFYAAKNCSVPFVTTFHGTYSSGNKLKLFYNSIMTRGVKVIAVSNFIKNHIVDNYKIDPKAIEVIHRGIDTEIFNTESISIDRTNKAYELVKVGKGLPVILLPARMTSWKGHEFLLDALKHIPKNLFDCVFVGKATKGNSYINNLHNKIKDLNLENNVKIIDAVQDMPALYKISDIIVSTSTRPEAFGRIALEAQAMEKPIIATNHGGSKETIVHNKTGWLINKDSPMELSAIIQNVLKMNTKDKRQITKKARQHVIENFSLEKMQEKTFALYKGINTLS